MSAKPLALLIIDRDDRICEFGFPRRADEFAEKVERWNLSDREMAYRVVPVGEIPVWRPIETAPKNGSPILVTKAGGSTGAVRWDVDLWVSATWADCHFMAPEFWQPLPAAPEAES